MPKLFRFMGLAVLYGVLAVACGDEGIDDNGGNGNAPPPPSLVGVWAFESASLDGASADIANVLDWAPGTATAELQILENGAFVYQELDGSGTQLSAESGSVFVNDDDVLELDFQTNDDGVVDRILSFRLIIADDRLVLHEIGSTLVFELARLSRD